MIIIKKSLQAATIAGLIIASSAVYAKITPEEAKKLDTVLTPVGAERAGNADGTIPAWNPDFKPPAQYKGAGHEYPDPYADEKPLFSITGKNYRQYKDKLTPGMLALFKNYRRTFRMDIYPSHRDGSYSDFILKETRKNATRSELLESGKGVANAFGGAPFPIPKSGLEVLWNTMLAKSAYAIDGKEKAVIVYRDGDRQEGETSNVSYAPYFDPDMTLEKFEEEDLPFLATLVNNLAPTREKGKSYVVHEYADMVEHPRMAWTYSPGVRRVRRAPTVAYDSPQGLGNWHTADETYGFNGSPELYDWELLGKKEVYIPYNSYRFESSNTSMDELLTRYHPNPDYMRYELHRVWVVRAKLKAGKRNVYKTRDLFIDEDSWTIVAVDQYDNRDKLWRTSMFNSINLFDVQGVYRRSGIYHDVRSREYYADALMNENKPYLYNTKPKQMSYFKSSTLKKLGVR